jgi:hypothetical protein
VHAVVEGDVRGWVRRDGAIDLVLSARRDLTREGRGGRLFAEAGRKGATVNAGEAVRFTLPAVKGPAGADSRLIESLDGHTFSLVLVAKTQAP